MSDTGLATSKALGNTKVFEWVSCWGFPYRGTREKLKSYAANAIANWNIYRNKAAVSWSCRIIAKRERKNHGSREN